VGLFDRVKELLTGSDADRAKDAQQGTTESRPAGTDRAETHEATMPRPDDTAPSPEGRQVTPTEEPQGQQHADPGTPVVQATSPTGEPAAQGPRTHTVQRGDTLAAIAERYGVDLQALADANGLDNPDLIYPGQVFSVPER